MSVKHMRAAELQQFVNMEEPAEMNIGQGHQRCKVYNQ